MKLGILTSVDTRHRYFANRLADAFPVVGIVYEKTGYTPATADLDELTGRERSIVQAHFEERSRQESLFFGDHSDELEAGESRKVRRLEAGSLNSDETVRFLLDAGVEALAVFGTNLIRPPLLDRFAGRTINLHLGLSPYYRGTATNFYPLLNEEPEYVGATIHLMDAGIDSGPILRHARPRIVAGDQPHTIGCKAIEAGIEAMIAILHDYETDRLEPVPQWHVPNAKFYRRRDYHPRQVVELYRKWEAGLIPRYLERASTAPKRIRLIEG